MENTAAATTTSAPTSTPTPAPTPAPAPQVQSAPPVSTMAEGGTTSSGGGIKEIVKNLNWVEVGFGVLGAAALFYAIYYFRYNINNQKSFVKTLESKVDDLTIRLSDVSSALTKKEENQLDIFM